MCATRITQGQHRPDDDDRHRRLEDLATANSAPLDGDARRRVGQPADAADVVCDVFLVAWRRIDVVPPGRSATLWLYGVARRVLAKQPAQRPAPRGAPREAAPAARDRAGGTGRRPRRRARPRRAREALPIDREVLSLSAWEELTPTEIGATLGVSTGAVRVRLHQARRPLRDELAAEQAVTTRSVVGHGGGGAATAAPGTKEER